MSNSQEIVISLRPAKLADLDLLKYWDEQPHVITSNPNDQWDWDTELRNNSEGREQLIAEIDSRPIGFIEITDPAHDESNYWGDVEANVCAIDIWIGQEKDLGKGYGTKMMQLALAKCFADTLVTAVLVDPLASNIRAHRFYKRLGFRLLEKRWFNRDECLVFRLSRTDWDSQTKS